MPKNKSESKAKDKSVAKGKSAPKEPPLPATTEPDWFEYPVMAYPHHTDYASIVWHGTYVTWLEEARVAYLQKAGMGYHELVEMGCELPVFDLSIRYHQSLLMGEQAIVKARIVPSKGVRLNWEYQIKSPDDQTLYITAQVTLVPLDPKTRKVLRRLPPAFQQALDQHA